MLGSDSAPHPSEAKECCGCAAGVYSAPVLLPRTVQLFEEHNALGSLQAFVSDNARRIHRLADLPQRSVTLKREPWIVPARYESGSVNVVSYEAGKEISWKLA
jgi:dihydroorotase